MSEPGGTFQDVVTGGVGSPTEIVVSDESPALRPKVYRAIAWSSGASVFIQIISFSAALVVTRLVSPTDFGRMALAVVVVGFFGIISETGLATSLTQRHQIDRRHESAAFYVQVAASAGAAIVIVLGSGLLADLMRQPAIRLVLVLLGCGLVVGSLGAVPRAILIRDLKMQRIAMIDVSTVITSGVVGVTLAMLGYGVWALAWAAVCSAGVSVLGGYLATGWTPAAKFSRTAARDLFVFARPFYGYTLINYLVRNGDNFLVGRFLGPLQLGLYSRAYALLLVPTRQTTSVIGGSLQVSLARFASDKPRSRRVYLEACSHIVFIVMPVMTFGAILTADFVRIVLGPQWVAAIPTIQILAIVGIVEPLVATCGWLYFAQGRADLSLRVSLLLGPLYLAAIAVGVAAGSAASVAMAYLLISVALAPVLLATAGGLIGIRLRDYARCCRGAFVSSLGAGACVLASRQLLVDSSSVTRLIVGLAVGSVVYLLLARAFKLPQLVMALDLLARKFGRQKPEAQA
ncbi:lipopolysaccharide biosynthesis protein [Aeromicrobium sp.]|uniref:lipopolysaccharide biosynthesis protein n=1 Tax=Aeromicrobium sp. TaxID=1871063 RepID=UPI0019AC8558|nr:lipopolysaccharide biosynthesis protein [Aeromicrobium sp.]MBC7630445.1 lipopolysaccharide biosynthesis protein [Aeromicrobium sp.]